jgi:hypothetical protein
MILSKSNNFLLLKNKKVGGTSLEIPLSMVVPEDAIVTPRTSNDPAWALEEENYDGYKPRNYDGFYNHMSYSEINLKVDLTNIKAYIFVRNPYNAVLSHFFHRLYFINKNYTWNSLDKTEQKLLVDKYFNNKLGWSWHTSNKHIYLSSDGNIQVDNFLIYENGIESEINNILIKHNIPKINITQNEKAFKPKFIKPEDVFSSKYLNQIHKEWFWEFKTFGYNKI